MKFFILILAFFFTQNCFGEIDKISPLKQFIRVLVEDSEAGYVLFHKKPVCVHAYFFKDSFSVNSESHKESVALRKGAAVWSKLKKENSDVIIHISQDEDPLIRGYAHLLVINIPLFHRAVNDNLALFQYILGPSVTSHSLLQGLICENQPFHALLKYDKVLIGILLGFGTQNALYVSRMENILEASYNENPPFLSPNLSCQDSLYEYTPFPPAFGFKSLATETKEYAKKIELSSPSLTEQRPNFIFGWLKEERENKKLIADLECVQAKTRMLIESENYEAGVICKLIGEQHSPFLKHEVSTFSNLSNQRPAFALNEACCSMLKFSQKPVKELTKPINIDKNSEVIAKGIWEILSYHDRNYLDSFLEGMDSIVSIPHGERLAYFSNYINDFIEGRDNLKAADIFFQKLKTNEEYTPIVPDLLYYKTLANGENGGAVCKGTLVTLTYSICSPIGHFLGNAASKRIDLVNTICGFAQGVLGMRVGETREILIHPSLAYGFETLSLDKCIYLKAIVSLEDVHNQASLCAIEPIDLDFLLDPEALKLRELNYKNALRKKGEVISTHLRKSKEIDMSLVKAYLRQFLHNDPPATTQEEQDLINDVHWNIYYSNDC